MVNVQINHACMSDYLPRLQTKEKLQGKKLYL